MEEFKNISDLVTESKTKALFDEFEAEYNRMTPEEREQDRRDTLDRLAAEYNAKPGIRNIADCQICKGKEFVAVADYEHDTINHLICACAKRVNNLLILKESGLSEVIKDFTFDKFDAKDKYQATMKGKAKAYLKDGGNDWFVVLGQTGAGKTHICTAICGEYINRGLSVRYFRWMDEGKLLKRLANGGNDDQYSREIWKFKDCDVLYIDDLFKRKPGAEVADADIKLALELINYRIDNRKKTIISGEDGLESLTEIDGAIAGRINQQAGKYLVLIDKGEEKNYRFKSKKQDEKSGGFYSAYRDPSSGELINPEER